ncbi:MAG: dihydrodipicolinate synthase family protein [Armatimonadota bacterium]
MTLPTGVLPVLQMPFHDDETIDFPALLRECDVVCAQGAHGICFALASELFRLDTREREEVVETLGNHLRGRLPFVAGVGSESTANAVRLAQHAASAGANVLMATPPLCTAATEIEIERYYGRIADAVDLPIIVQDASSYAGAPLSVDLQIRIALRHGIDRVGFKPESNPVGPVVRALRESLGAEVAIYEGSGGAELAQHFPLGLAGTIPGSEMVPAIVALWNALRRDDAARADRISIAIRGINSLGSGLDGYLAIEKHRLVRLGMLPTEHVRGPRSFVLDAPTRAEADRWFECLDKEIAA